MPDLEIRERVFDCTNSLRSFIASTVLSIDTCTQLSVIMYNYYILCMFTQLFNGLRISCSCIHNLKQYPIQYTYVPWVCLAIKSIYLMFFGVGCCSLLGFVMEALLGLISCDYWVVVLWREKPRVLSNFCGIGLINAYT